METSGTGFGSASGESLIIGRDRGLVLIGYRGSGKSTVGRELASRLSCPFADTDAIAEADAGMTIAEIFAREGEPSFRDRESAAVVRATNGPPGVLATGGGAIIRPENRALLRRFGLVVWLRTDPVILRRRLLAGQSQHAPGSSGNRPALTNLGTLGEIEAVMAQRAPWYQETADVILETSRRSLDEVVRAVLDACRAPRSKRARGKTSRPNANASTNTNANAPSSPPDYSAPVVPETDTSGSAGALSPGEEG